MLRPCAPRELTPLPLPLCAPTAPSVASKPPALPPAVTCAPPANSARRPDCTAPLAAAAAALTRKLVKTHVIFQRDFFLWIFVVIFFLFHDRSLIACCSPDVGATACTDCSAGRFSGSTAPACDACAAGTYAASTGSASCDACPAGTYLSDTGAMSASACTSCSTGTYSAAGSSSCTSCGTGTYGAATGAVGCTACEPG